MSKIWAFTPKESTTTALLSVIHDWHQHLEHGTDHGYDAPCLRMCYMWDKYRAMGVGCIKARSDAECEVMSVLPSYTYRPANLRSLKTLRHRMRVFQQDKNAQNCS